MTTPVTQAQAREAIQRARPFGGYGLTEPFEVLLAFIAQHPDAQQPAAVAGKSEAVAWRFFVTDHPTFKPFWTGWGVDAQFRDHMVTQGYRAEYATPAPVPAPEPAAPAVSEDVVEAALHARVPGGAEVHHWLPMNTNGTPHQTATNVRTPPMSSPSMTAEQVLEAMRGCPDERVIAAVRAAFAELTELRALKARVEGAPTGELFRSYAQNGDFAIADCDGRSIDISALTGRRVALVGLND